MISLCPRILFYPTKIPTNNIHVNTSSAKMLGSIYPSKITCYMYEVFAMSVNDSMGKSNSEYPCPHNDAH